MINMAHCEIKSETYGNHKFAHKGFMFRPKIAQIVPKSVFLVPNRDKASTSPIKKGIN